MTGATESIEDPSTLIWEQANTWGQLQPIMTLVEPDMRELQAIQNCFQCSSVYRGFVAMREGDDHVYAIALATVLF